MTTALPCQRDLFDMPRDVCFLNAAAWAPLSKATVELGREAVGRKGQPWRLDAAFQQEQCEAARAAAARVIGADADDVAIIPSISYGVATAARILGLDPRGTVIVLADDHASPVLEWKARPDGLAMTVRTVTVAEDRDWTAAVLGAIEEEAGEGLALVSISSVHWADGGLVDMDRVSAATKRHGVPLLVDATHAVGVVDCDVARVDPDFLLFPTYKWLLGPYGRSFLYVAKRWQDGIPLEQTMSGRVRVRAEDPVYFTDTNWVDSARRYDMGQRDFFVSLDMARHGMELVHGWGRAALEARLAMLTRRITDGLRDGDLPVETLSEAVRAPHILSAGFSEGMPDGLPAALKERDVFVAPRLGRLRIAPHAYNDEADCDRFVEALSDAMKGLGAA